MECVQVYIIFYVSTCWQLIANRIGSFEDDLSLQLLW